jgi:hypothetical protein
MVNPKKKSKEDSLFNIEGILNGVKDPFGPTIFDPPSSKMVNPKKKSMGDNLFNTEGILNRFKNPFGPGIFDPLFPEGKKCEKCGVQKKDDKPLCSECLKKENRKCEVCGKPSGKYPKCVDCNKLSSPPVNPNPDPRAKYPPKYRTDSGHYVRSKAEQAIANWFYKQDIVAAYEKKFPEEYIICDFYLPKWDVWIEYWGLENEGYLENKQRKLDIYEKHKKKLINLYEADIQNNLEDLPERLREFIPNNFVFR